MDTLRQDIRYAVRRLIRSPGFTVVALLTLALGIGANSAIFSVVNAVLLKPLPYRDPAELVGVYHLSDGRRATMSGPNFYDVKRTSKTLQDAAAIARGRTILTGRGEPVRLDIATVSASLFQLLGVSPALGRAFVADDNRPGKTHVTVLSHTLWRERFGADARIVGKQIVLDGESYEVVGVMPEKFSYPAARALWLPLEYDDDLTAKQRGALSGSYC
ncbi:MAG: ABC transporter permease [Vicinamibacterales bacterium]